MLNLGLSKAEQARYESLLARSHRIKTKVQLLNLEHDYISDISDVLMGGQVNVDANADIRRSLSITMLDPKHQLALDSNSPSDGAMYYDRMLKVTQTIIEPDRSWWVDVPLFCGPIRKLDRSGAVASVECHGKEALILPNSYYRKTWKKGAKTTEVIVEILTMHGESASKIHVPDMNKRLRKDVSIGPETSPWKTILMLAASIGCYAFYDGRGVFMLRKRTNAVRATFDGAVCTEAPRFSYDQGDIVNVVTAIGKKPKGAKRRVKARVATPSGHPLTLKRNGVILRYPVVIKDDNIGTRAEALAVAKRELARGIIQAADAQWKALPHPHLEEFDVVRIKTDEYSSPVMLQKFGNPLLAGDSSFGFLKNLTPNKRAIRRRR